MEFHQLKCFRELAITQNCSMAATNLNMSRASVRLNIKELEGLLGTELFDSSNQASPYTLTKNGKILLRYANQLLALEAKAKSSLNSTSMIAQKMVGICYNENLLHSFLPVIFNNFYRTHSRSDIQLTFYMRHFQEDVISMFEDGSADIAFTQEVPSNKVNHMQVARDQLYILLPRTHPLANKRRLRLQDLEDTPLIMPSLEYLPDSSNLDSHLGNSIASMIEAEHINPTIASISLSLPGRIAYVQAGLGYTITSDYPIDESKLASIEIDNPYSRRNIYMLWPKNRKLSPAATEIRDYCIDSVKYSHEIPLR